MTDSIEVRVAKGAAWLDATRPGWRDAINLGELNIGSGCNCVCGQVFGLDATVGDGYGFALNYTDLESKDVEFGFMWAADTCSAPANAEIKALTAEWRRVIHQGREVSTHPATQREAVQA